MSCGHYHSMALSLDNRMWTWGWGVHGQLGLGNIEDALLPSHVSTLAMSDVIQMAAGYSHTVVLTSAVSRYRMPSLCKHCFMKCWYLERATPITKGIMGTAYGNSIFCVASHPLIST